MLTELCQELRNWFDRERHSGTFQIVDGNIAADFLVPGQYYRVKGSIFSDGVHLYPSEDLQDETFTGEVWTLAIPPFIVALSDEIDAWRAKYEAVDSTAMSPFSSESFGGYSYTKSGNGSASGGNTGSGWQAAFASRLNRWRKI